MRRVVSGIALGRNAKTVTHTAKDGSDPQTAEGVRIIGNAAPAALAPLMPADAAEKLRNGYARQKPVGVAVRADARPVEAAARIRRRRLLHASAAALDETFADYAQGAALMAEEPGERMPPMSVVDYAAIDSGVPAPPYVLSVLGPDLLSNWDASDMDAYREKRGRWQVAIVRYLSSIYPGLGDAVVASSFNSALSVRQYLNAPDGAVYGLRRPRRPRSGETRSVRRARRYQGFIWPPPMPGSAATPASSSRPAFAPT